jgi:tetratricopeptide (TPR) repeat protein
MGWWAAVAAAGGAALLAVTLSTTRDHSESAPTTPGAVTPARPPIQADDLGAALRRGDRAMANTDFATALEAYQHVLSTNPDHAAARLAAGIAARKLHQYPLAKTHLERAATLATDDSHRGLASFELACALAKLGESQAALATLERAVELAGAKALEGPLRFDSDLDPLRGEEPFRRLLAGPPNAVADGGKEDDPGFHRATALIEEARALRRNSLDRAILRLEQCVATSPTYAPCHRNLGSYYAERGGRDGNADDYDRARRSYRRFLEVAPPDDEYVPKVRKILDER